MDQITYEWEGERVDTWLVKQFSCSRSFFHHILARNWVLVNNKPVKKSFKLKSWDKVLIDHFQRYLDWEILEETPNIDLPIVKETDDYLIINKPKWVLSHPTNVWEIHEPSVVWFLYHHYKNLPSIWTFIRAWLLHRLDKNTDWLMIVAKTEQALTHFKNLFQQKSESESIEEKDDAPLKKFYRACCHLTEKWKKFLESIKEFPFFIKEIVVPKIPHSIEKMWITKIHSFEIDKKEVSLNLEILTWRTHQIRYHLSSKWLPIIWDYLYGTDEWIPMKLTAYKLIFPDLQGKLQTIEI